MDEQVDGTVKGFGVEESREGWRVFCTEGVEERGAVGYDGIEVRDVGGEAVGEVMALVVEGSDSEARLDEVDRCELDKPVKAWMTVTMTMGAAEGAGPTVE